jgi:hypothetical protein
VSMKEGDQAAPPSLRLCNQPRAFIERIEEVLQIFLVINEQTCDVIHAHSKINLCTTASKCSRHGIKDGVGCIDSFAACLIGRPSPGALHSRRGHPFGCGASYERAGTCSASLPLLSAVIHSCVLRE